ncbi:MAG: peptidase M1 [Cyclobacteriaceae bacterium]|nr:MAG: peptidase M1 [Cyclobacteriaceae bacterium]
MKHLHLFLLLLAFTLPAQDYRWQQHVNYQMKVRLDVKTHRLEGTQKLTYTNHSPDTLSKVYYHLYYNAFQPGSMMDVRSRTIADPDRRVTDRIAKLSDSEIGYQHILELKQDGRPASYTVNGTLLEVTLPRPILPGTKAVFDMKFEAQVPVQIRRTGRNNREGIAYSMTQWYPKMAEYDHQGWHAYQYVGREFHGVWGDFDVQITIDPAFVIGATGVLQNPNEIGHGYEKNGSKVNRPQGELTWHFVAKNVIDFAWAADPDYTHTITQVPDGPEVHFFYQRNEKTAENWNRMQEYVVRHFQFMNRSFGKYPYPVYSVIQGGDGGMEYPMCTLVLGEGNFSGLLSTTVHEICHSWFQAVLASNESLYPWMDEGFTSFAQDESLANLFNTGNNPHEDSYQSYLALVRSGLQEPASQHSDHFTTNRAYSTAAYSMGSLLLNQLKYIMGDEAFYRAMRNYYNAWKFRHPEPNDFIRIMEKTSGMSLHWFMRYWIHTTKRIDYGIKQVLEQDGKTFVVLERIGELPMPAELTVTWRNGTTEVFYLPLNETLGNKKAPTSIKWNVLTPWPWVNPTYIVEINRASKDILLLELDARQQTADINRENNRVDFSIPLKGYADPTR